MAVSSPAGTPEDPGKVASRKVVGLTRDLDLAADDLAAAIENYLHLAVRGVRSDEVAATIERHLTRFTAWFTEQLANHRVSAVTRREVAGWRDHLREHGNQTTAGGAGPMAPATVNNHLAHLSALFTWIAVHSPDLLPYGDPTKGVDPLPLPAPEPRALGGQKIRTVKNVLDRMEGFHRLRGRDHHGGRGSGDRPPAVHRHARPLRDRAIVFLLLGTGLRRAELVGLDLTQLQPRDPGELRRAKKAKLVGVRGKGRTTRTLYIGVDARDALADYLETERPGDVDTRDAEGNSGGGGQQGGALFLSAASIATRRPGGRLSPRSINTIVAEVGRFHDAEITDPDRQLGGLRPHDLRHSFAYALSEASGNNRAELERRLGHRNDRYLRLYTNPPEDVAAGWVEEL